VLGDETASQARRDQMAIASAAYCHPKLSAVGLSSHVGGGGGGNNVSLDVQIYAVPRGAKFGKDGTITIDGEATELTSVEPYEGTPALTDESTPAPFEPPLAERLEVIEVDTSNVTVLRRRSDDDDDPAGAG
jgi:hypothetical protein